MASAFHPRPTLVGMHVTKKVVHTMDVEPCTHQFAHGYTAVAVGSAVGHHNDRSVFIDCFLDVPKDHRHKRPAGGSIKSLIQDFLSPACARTVCAIIRVAETPKIVQVQLEVPYGRRNAALPSLLGVDASVVKSTLIELVLGPTGKHQDRRPLVRRLVEVHGCRRARAPVYQSLRVGYWCQQGRGDDHGNWLARS